MADDERPPTDRNAAIRARFEGLPAAGSPSYWAKLEDTAGATRLELEILAMCARERRAAGKRADAERVFSILWDRVQRTVKSQIRQTILQGAPDREGLVEDIMQDCAIGLWQELAGEGRTFLTEGFWHKMSLLLRNVINQRLIEEGIKVRPGVHTPTRVPRSKVDSADESVSPEGGPTLGEQIPDDASDDPFSFIEIASDIRDLLERLTSEERLLLQNEITGELTRAEMGERLDITDRAVRMRLSALHKKLRALYHKSDNPGESGGGAADGEEGPR